MGVGLGPPFLVSERKPRSGGEGQLAQGYRVVGADPGQVGFPCVSLVTPLLACGLLSKLFPLENPSTGTLDLLSESHSSGDPVL